MYRAHLSFFFITFILLVLSCGGKKETSPPSGTQETPSPSLTLQSSSQSGIADGTTPVTITATVKTPQGNLAPDGTAVTFSTDLGGFIESGGSNAYSTSTTAGVATARLTSSTVGTATVTVTSLGIQRRITIAFQIPGGSSSGGSTSGGSTSGGSGSGGSGPSAGYLYLTAPPIASIGLDTKTTITGWGFDAKNNPLPSGTTVTWTILSGPGTRDNWGIVESSSSLDSSGKFTTNYYSGLIPGNVTLHATATVGSAVITKTITLTLIDRSPALVQLELSPQSMDADGRSTSTLTVYVFDGTGQAVPDGTLVTLTILPSSTGSGALDQTSLTTTKGKAQATFTAGTRGGNVDIEARAGTISANRTLTLVDRSPRTLTLSVNPMTIEQNGQATITATVLDGNNRPVLPGTPVSFSVSGVAGVVINPPNVPTDDQGRATTTLFAGLSTGVATISVTTANNVTNTAFISIVQPSIGSIQFLSANPNIIGVKGSSSRGNSSLPEVSLLEFQVLTSSGNPVPDGTPVTFALEAPVGTTLQVTQATTVNGIVQTRIRSGTVSGIARVIAFTSFGGNVFIAPSNNVVIQAGPPMDGHLSISVKPDDILVFGRSYDGLLQNFTLRLGDRYSNPVPDDTAVYFSSEAGIVDPNGFTARGEISFKLKSANPRPFAVTNAGSIHNPFLTITYSGCTPPCHSWTKAFRVENALVTLIALVLGEERYWDLNGNGVYDSGEPFVDLSEPYLDINNNGQYDSVLTDYSGTFGVVAEPFWDSITQDGVWNSGNGRYDSSTYLFLNETVVWSKELYDIQYQPSWFFDFNSNNRFDPGVDLIAASKSADATTVAAFAARCGASGIPIVGNVSPTNLIQLWIGDDLGVVPRDDGQITLSIGGGIGASVDSSLDWFLPPDLMGFRGQVGLKSTASQPEQTGQGFLILQTATGGTSTFKFYIPICALP